MQLNRMESSNSKEEASLNVSNVFDIIRKKWIKHIVSRKNIVRNILFFYLEKVPSYLLRVNRSKYIYIYRNIDISNDNYSIEQQEIKIDNLRESLPEKISLPEERKSGLPICRKTLGEICTLLLLRTSDVAKVVASWTDLSTSNFS